MATDEAEEERGFIAQLQARSGRDLAQWMAAITAQGFSDKNHTIDWLRAQGFPFARASWLERIHNNGGKPIYGAERPPGSGEPVRREASIPPPPPTPRERMQRESLLAAAKGYRPLFELLEEEIRKALPGVAIAPKTTYMAIGKPREFAVITLHATELRLGLDLGAHPYDARLTKPRAKFGGGSISHMLVLTDARQVNAELMALIKAASERSRS